jgi:hypothetical protein
MITTHQVVNQSTPLADRYVYTGDLTLDEGTRW